MRSTKSCGNSVMAMLETMTPNLSLNRTARWRRLRAVRSRPVSLVRWASVERSV